MGCYRCNTISRPFYIWSKERTICQACFDKKVEKYSNDEELQKRIKELEEEALKNMDNIILESPLDKEYEETKKRGIIMGVTRAQQALEVSTSYNWMPFPKPREDLKTLREAMKEYDTFLSNKKEEKTKNQKRNSKKRSILMRKRELFSIIYP